MAQACLRIGSRTVEVFGPRAEQLAHLLDIQGAKKLAERLGDHVADEEDREQELELDEREQRELLEALDAMVENADDVSDDLRELRTVLQESLSS